MALLTAAAETAVLPLQNGAFAGPYGDELFLVARVLFGGVLAFMGLNHFLNLEDMTGYADAKGVPAPNIGVLVSGVILVLGGIGILAGVAPALAAAGIAIFFVVTTPTIHDFWAVPADQQQNEMTHFLKNLVMLGAALAFLVLGLGGNWSYAAGIYLL